MKLVKSRILKTFVWVVVVGMLLIVMLSLHEIAIRQKVRMHIITSAQVSGLARAPETYLEDTRSNQKKQNNTVLTETNTTPRPVTHIGFLKVHKAASTTTQAIFLRFGWRRNLTFVLPPEYNKFGYPNIISTNESVTKYNTLPPPPGKTFDILCNHVVYGKEEWASILPADTVMVGTIREPFSHFRSVLNYFNPRSILFIQSAIDPNDPVGTFLKDPTKYETKNVRSSFTNNRLSFEYGVHPDIIQRRNVAAFDEYLREVLDKQFKVVLLAEKYDESLVLMKRKLNWSLKDIMFAMKNVRSVAKKDRYELQDKHKALHRNYSVFDYMLYDFFLEKLNKQIEQEGTDFMDEVNNFKEVRELVEKFCHVVSRHIRSLKIDKGEWTDGFEISRDDCNLMHVGEIPFTQMIRKKQYGSATWTGIQRAKTEKNQNGKIGHRR